MTNGKNATLPDSLMAELEQLAEVQKRSVDDVLKEAVQTYINRQEFEETLSFGERHAKSRGLTHADVSRAIAKVRDERGH